MKKLPKIYQNKINSNISNNRNMCYVEEIDNIDIDIKDKLNNIKPGLGKDYNHRVLITTKDNIYDTYIIAKTKEEIITSNNNIILKKDIINIQEKNKN